MRRGGGRRKERGEVDTCVRGETKGKKEEGTEGGVRQSGEEGTQTDMYTMSMCTHVAFVSVTDTSTIKRQHSTRRVPHACLAHQIHDAWPLAVSRH